MRTSSITEIILSGYHWFEKRKFCQTKLYQFEVDLKSMLSKDQKALLKMTLTGGKDHQRIMGT